MSRAALAILLGLVFGGPLPSWAQGTLPLVPAGSVWSYLDDGSDQGTAWREPGFAETWATGPAELGFGDGGEATVISNNGISFYFRHEFVLAAADLAQIEALRMGIRRDDGVIVYINGQAVYTQGLRSGDAFDVTANVSMSETYFYPWVAPPGVLAEGTNLVAVEVHNTKAMGNDISFDFFLEATTGDVEIWRGPYLQRGTSSSATLRFLTDVAIAPTVHYGDSPSTLDTAVAGPVATDHVIALGPLDPDTRYFYSIEASGSTLAGADPNHWFRTYPEPGSSAALRFWAVGDSGSGQFGAATATLQSYGSYTQTTPTGAFVLLGDNAYRDGTIFEYHDAVFETFRSLLRNTFVWPSIGNHDTTSFSGVSAGPYFDVFSPPPGSGSPNYYSFDHGDVHFVALDAFSEDLDPNGAQITWLSSDLAASSALWKIALVHSPPYTKGSHDSDVESSHLRVRENALPVLEAHGVQLVLAGHSHDYERSFLIRGHYGVSSTWDPDIHLVDGGDGCPDDAFRTECSGGADGAYRGDGTVYVVVGNASRFGSPGTLDHPVMAYADDTVLGSLVVDVERDRLEARFLQQDGVVADRFVIRRAGAPVPVLDPLAAAALAALLAAAGGIALRLRRA